VSPRATFAVLFVLVTMLLLAAGTDAAGVTGSAPLSVQVDRARISTKLGHRFAFHSTIWNHGSAPVSGVIAHLNVLSLRSGVYVDPEDWSTHRTLYLGTIPAGGSTTSTWRIQAVNAGRFGVYVAALTSNSAARAPTTGPGIEIAVADRKTLNSSGILPLALGIPAGLGLLAVGLRLQRRR
jgi:hypothetical protein